MSRTKVVYKRLKRAWGYAYIHQDKIELYDKLKGRKHLEILIHEKLHLMFPDLDEKAIVRHSRELSSLLWNQDYRRLK
jgi:hypothetical protein